MKEKIRPSCWACKHQDVLMISEVISCHKRKGNRVYPWEAETCKHFVEDT